MRLSLRHRWSPARRLLLTISFVGLAGLVFVPLLGGIKPSGIPAAPERIKITAIKVNFDDDHPDRTRFGKLIFRRGLALYSKSPDFGGYSALAIDPSGHHLIAISDDGTWLRATLDYDGRYLKGLSDAVIGPLLDAHGKPYATRTERDSEGFTLIDGNLQKGDAFISFERDHRIQHYPFDGDRFGPAGARVLPLPAGSQKMPANSGFEAIADLHYGPDKGALLAFAERLQAKNGNMHGNLRGWLIGGQHPGPIYIADIGGFSITDATQLPDGDIILLERRFRYSEGVKMRLRRIRASALKPDAVIRGEILLQADDRYSIDNMEAIGASKDARGQTILTIMADDNFSALQRNLILQFVLPKEPKLSKTSNMQ
jgi:hypothetical protein